jgi:hypothetical protein
MFFLICSIVGGSISIFLAVFLMSSWIAAELLMRPNTALSALMSAVARPGVNPVTGDCPTPSLTLALMASFFSAERPSFLPLAYEVWAIAFGCSGLMSLLET